MKMTQSGHQNTKLVLGIYELIHKGYRQLCRTLHHNQHLPHLRVTQWTIKLFKYMPRLYLHKNDTGGNGSGVHKTFCFQFSVISEMFFQTKTCMQTLEHATNIKAFGFSG